MDPFGSRTWKPTFQDSLFSMGFRPKGFCETLGSETRAFFDNEDINSRQNIDKNGVPNAGLEGSGQAHSRHLRQKMEDLVHATKSRNIITYTRRTQHHRYKYTYLNYKGMFFGGHFCLLRFLEGPLSATPSPILIFWNARAGVGVGRQIYRYTRIKHMQLRYTQTLNTPNTLARVYV